jgi:hypothetical protein
MALPPALDVDKPKGSCVRDLRTASRTEAVCVGTSGCFVEVKRSHSCDRLQAPHKFAVCRSFATQTTGDVWATGRSAAPDLPRRTGREIRHPERMRGHRLNRLFSHSKTPPCSCGACGTGLFRERCQGGLDSERLWRDGGSVRAPVNQLHSVLLARSMRAGRCPVTPVAISPLGGLRRTFGVRSPHACPLSCIPPARKAPFAIRRGFHSANPLGKPRGLPGFEG